MVAVAPDPENAAVDKVKLDPDFNPVIVLPLPENDLMFPTSMANKTELKEEFFGPL